MTVPGGSAEDHRPVVVFVFGRGEVEVDDHGDVVARRFALALVAVDLGSGDRVGEGAASRG